jgi:hypothetical protein
LAAARHLLGDAPGGGRQCIDSRRSCRHRS